MSDNRSTSSKIAESSLAMWGALTFLAAGLIVMLLGIYGFPWTSWAVDPLGATWGWIGLVLLILGIVAGAIYGISSVKAAKSGELCDSQKCTGASAVMQ